MNDFLLSLPEGLGSGEQRKSHTREGGRRRACHVGDICELSPTSKAKCVICGEMILKGQPRVGKEDYLFRGKKYIRRYYHKACFQELPGDHLINGKIMVNRSLEDMFQDVQNEELEHQRIISERNELRERLISLRARLALRFGVEPFMVFVNTTLDDLVLKMPQTRAELMKVSGIKEKRYNKFGCAILAVVRDYVRSHFDLDDDDDPHHQPGIASSSAI